MKRRLLSLTLTLVLALTLVPVTLAAGDDEARQAAQTLYDKGLFRGVGDSEDGELNFDLDRPMNRAEAVTMLVRLLGKEAEAVEGDWTTPFTDVPAWAAPSVGCAYENGLTKGVSDTAFGSKQEVTAAEYLTFVLRALGYDSETDFQWDAPWALSDQVGLTSGQFWSTPPAVRSGGLPRPISRPARSTLPRNRAILKTWPAPAPSI